MRALLLAAALLLAPAAQAAPHWSAEWFGGDPLEAANRRIHGFNMLAHRHVLAPAATLYTSWIPAPVRAGLGRAAANLGEPVTAASALVAGETQIAATAAIRFGINTTLGLGGVRDRAAEMGYKPAPMALGQALCRRGVPPGPFLVLPLLGPTTLRDAGAAMATSLALSQLVGPDSMVAWSAGTGFLDYAELRPALERLERDALDSYASLRSAHRQRRAAACATDAAARDPDPTDD